MIERDIQTDSPVAYCKCCGGEIYEADKVYNLDEVYQTPRHIIHTDCLSDSLEAHKTEVLQYLFEDLVRLENVFSDLLEKYTAWDIFEGWDDDDGKY